MPTFTERRSINLAGRRGITAISYFPFLVQHAAGSFSNRGGNPEHNLHLIAEEKHFMSFVAPMECGGVDRQAYQCFITQVGRYSEEKL